MNRNIGRIAASLAALLAAGSLLAGCGEKPQAMEPHRNGMFSGKADTRPWEGGGSSAFAGSRWAAGDRADWERALRTRNQSQNEYVRAQ